MIEVKAIGVTKPVVDYIPDSEGIVSYTARVSNPKNQENFETADRLLAYCAREGHWSVFDMCNLIMEVKAPRDISRQILRHQSAKFQEFSQRYAEVTDEMFTIRQGRSQDKSNRQNSIDNLRIEIQNEWKKRQQILINCAKEQYSWALKHGIAKECARVVLPEGNTMSCMYMNATTRTWIHYLKLRSGNGTQKEHCDVADTCLIEFKKYFPSLVETLNAI